MKITRWGAAILCLSMMISYGSAVFSPVRVEDKEIPMAEAAYIDAVELGVVELEDEVVALAETPVILQDLLMPEASGTLVKKNGKAMIDYSNTQDGYVMVCYTANTTKRLKAQVKSSGITYTYNLNPGEWTTFPLSEGNGSYQITVYENISSSKYATVLSQNCKVTLKDEFAPFLRPNQHVNYSAASKTIAKAQELTNGITDPLKKVEAVYNYVVKNVRYDRMKAATVESGYLPVLDTILETRKGICFDYAALMTGMLRSQGVPCKMVFGYAGTIYHAWISVWTEDTGWVDGAIFFDGTTWHRMDPTFASTGRQSKSIMEFIGNEKNYTTKYLY